MRYILRHTSEIGFRKANLQGVFLSFQPVSARFAGVVGNQCAYSQIFSNAFARRTVKICLQRKVSTTSAKLNFS